MILSEGLSRAGRVHYAIALGVLLAAAAGWNVLMYGAVLAKEPVPPPAGTDVQEHRLHSFPESFGSFVLAPEKEALREEGAERDGVDELIDDELEILGTLKHKWNWYYMATFRDTPKPTRNSRYMRLNITYYTGLLEAVPHVPERCIVAGGGVILPGDSGAFDVPLVALPKPWEAWHPGLKVERTAYLGKDPKTGKDVWAAQYHVFSMNGKPSHDWMAVRLEVGDLRNTYCYFAKIQLAPEGPGLQDRAASDAFCAKFLRQAMPEIVKFLPSAADVSRLEKGEGEVPEPKQRN